MTTPIEREKYEIAAALAVLTFDKADMIVSDLMRAHTLDGLNERLLDELEELDTRVAAEGRVEINNWIDGEWLAGMIRAEFGSYVATERTGGTISDKQYLVQTDPS